MSLYEDDDGVPYIQLGKFKIRLEKQELNEEMKMKAEKELRETPENVEKGFKELRALISEEPDFNVPMELDEYLIKFLRPSKFYAESAFEQMKRFYKFKQIYPQYCEGLSPSNDSNMLKQGIISFQEMRDENGSRIMLIQPGTKWKPSLCTLGEVFRGVQIALEAAMVEPNTQVGGVVVILDVRGFSLNHVIQFTPSFAKMVVDWIQECIPLRLKAVHIINQPYIFNMVFAIFKPFLGTKLRNRIRFHGENRPSLLKYIPAKALRLEYGGTMDSPELPGDVLCDLLCKYEDDYVLANTFGYEKKKSKKT